MPNADKHFEKGKTKNSEETDKNNPNFYEERQDNRIEISSNSEEDENANSAVGYFPMNTLSHNLKDKMGATHEEGFNSDRKKMKNDFNFKSKDTRGKLRESQSIGGHKNLGEDEEDDEQNKDSMVLDKGKAKFVPWESNHDWNNLSLEPIQDVDARSKVTKKSKNSKIGSRDGSKRAKRKIKTLVSLQRNREKSNVSRQGRRKVFKNKNNPIIFDEFKLKNKVEIN